MTNSIRNWIALLFMISPVVSISSCVKAQNLDFRGDNLDGQIVEIGGNPYVGEIRSARSPMQEHFIQTTIISTIRNRVDVNDQALAIIATRVEVDCNSYEMRILNIDDYNIHGGRIRDTYHLSSNFGRDAQDDRFVEHLCEGRSSDLGPTFSSLPDFVSMIDEMIPSTGLPPTIAFGSAD